MLIDIGGGSVEITISTGQNIVSTESYNLGTVRLLEKLGTKNNTKHPFGKLVREYAEAARYRIEREIGDEKIIVCAGTGGNVEEIGRLRQKLFKADSDRFVTMDELEELIERLESMSCDERISKLKLRTGRADVILPAAIVLHMIAGEAGVKNIHSKSRFEGWHPARYCGRVVTQSSPTSQGTGVGVCLAHGA